MKAKLYLLLNFSLLVVLMRAQPVNYVEAPVFDNSTSTGRGPNGTNAHVYMRACGLVKASELAGIATNGTISSFGFSLNAGAATTAPTGNFTLYLQNTSDITYNKGTSFSTAISTMAQVYASTLTIPLSSGATSVVVNLSTPFVYTGGGIYVAYDWYNPGPYSASQAIYRCNSGGLSPGLASYASNSAVSDLLGTTAFRPTFLWGVANSYTNELSVLSMDAPGRIAGGVFSTSHSVTATIRNNSNISKTNVVVSLNVAGSNTFATTQTISSIASGATASVSFAAFSPTAAGMNTLSVSVPADELNTNNSRVWTQSVTCNEWALNPAGVSYTSGAVGFNTGSGILAVNYTNPTTATLSGIRGGISTNAPAIGNGSWAVLLSASGSVIATSNTVTITSGLLGTAVDYTFATPQVLNASTNYYLGFAQPTGTAGYFPAGTYTNNYVPFLNYVTTTTLGGTPSPLASNLGYFLIEALFQSGLNIAVSPKTLTCGNSAVLSATTAATSYSWSGGPSNTDYTVAPLATSIYTVSGSNAFACVATQTVGVSVSPLPVAIIANTAAICAGETISVSVSGAPSFTWSTGPGLNTNSFTDTPLSSVVYSVQGSNSAGCLSSATLAVQVNTLPLISVSPVTVICGSPATLVATTSDSYTWTSGPSNTNHVVNPVVNTVYTVVASSTAGCSGSNTVEVTVTPISVNALASATSMCAGQTVTLHATGANTYTWSAGPSINASSFVDSPVVTTSYSVQAEGSAGCFGNDVVTVTVNSFTNLSANGNFSLCNGSAFSATASGGSTYTWTTPNGSYTTASISQTLFVTSVYTIQGLDQNGCAAIQTLTIQVYEYPIISFYMNPSNVICTGQSATVTAIGGDSHAWSNGVTTASIEIVGNTLGLQVFTVTATNGGVCSIQAATSVDVSECVGIGEFQHEEKLSVFPNPVSDHLYIDLPADGNYTVRLTNAFGQEVMYHDFQQTPSAGLDVTQKAKGIYLLNLYRNGKLVQQQKIIKH